MGTERSVLGTLFLGISLGLLGFLTGCTPARGLGFRVEAYQIDERQESTQTHKKPVGWKCVFTDCGEVKGS